MVGLPVPEPIWVQNLLHESLTCAVFDDGRLRNSYAISAIATVSPLGLSFKRVQVSHIGRLLKAGYINIHMGFKSEQIALTPPREDVEDGVWICMEDFE